MVRKSVTPPQLGVIAAVATISVMSLMVACTATIDGDSTQSGNNGTAVVPSQVGGSSGSTPGGSTAGTPGQQPSGSSGSGSSTTAPPAPTSLPTESECGATKSPGPRVLRRLTASEFAASIGDLFGDRTAAPVAQVFNDSRVLGFTVDSSTLRVQDLNADQLMTNAEAVASWAVTSKLQQLQQLATCSSHDAACATLFVTNFGRKAFRQTIDPKTDARVGPYTELFMAEDTFANGASSVITAMLQSPYFLYRSEVGDPAAADGTVTLTPFEVASSLSYLLTGSAPDDALLTAAAQVPANNDGALTAFVEAQATRLLAPAGGDSLSAPAQDALMGFMSGWLGLDRLTTNVKDVKIQALSDVQKAAMATETKKFILDIWGASTKNGVGDLFNADFTYVNKELADYYKLDSNGLTSDTFVRQTLNGKREGGILAQASILIGYARADLSSPTQRGHLVRSRIMCQDVAPPPPGLDTKFTASTSFQTTRDQYLKGHAAPDHQPCYGCHVLMDPIGVAFEHYDSFGNYRTEEQTVPIDSTGTIYAAGGTDGDVAIDGLSGDKGLQTYLAQADSVKSCLVRYWTYYAFGTAGWAEDKCTYDAIRGEAQAGSYSLKSVLKAITHTPRFTTRLKD